MQKGKELFFKKIIMNKVAKKKSKDVVSMPLINPNAAGIDVGDTLFSVAVPEGSDEQRYREFTAFTCDLKEIAAWLKECGVETVAMESTGVYWKPLFSVLIHEGFEVYLVNARHVKNVTGRKTDEKDAMWIQRLHSCGLLNSCFLPDEHTETLRTLVRFRRALMQDSSRFILRMQKALELMNIKIHTVIADITGKTGTGIIEAIIAGQRNPENFIPLIDPRIKAPVEILLKSLEGNWSKEHLCTLKVSYEMYNQLQQKITELEKVIEEILQAYAALKNDGEILPLEKKAEPKKIKRKTKNQPAFNTRNYLRQIHGTDVIEIFGISEICGLEVLAETGTDLSKWENENKFTGWLNLCPNNKVSGGKLISSHKLKKKPNLATQAFRTAANSLKQSNNWLGDYFRRMRAKGGNKYAIVATARKIAIIYYKMVRYKQAFDPVDLKEYQEKYKAAKIAWLERKLRQLKDEAA
jgi:hypothetical protein